MCSEIHHFSSFFSGMSDTRENQQIFLVKLRAEEEPLQLENQDSVGGNEEEVRAEGGELSSAQNSVPGDEDDGFKTPTSSHHKIPPMKQCPPPPRKSRTRHSKRKRKAWTVGARRSLPFHELAEVESIFRPAPDEDHGVVNESKRSRKVIDQ